MVPQIVWKLKIFHKKVILLIAYCHINITESIRVFVLRLLTEYSLRYNFVKVEPHCPKCPGTKRQGTFLHSPQKKNFKKKNKNKTLSLSPTPKKNEWKFDKELLWLEKELLQSVSIQHEWKNRRDMTTYGNNPSNAFSHALYMFRAVLYHN